MQERLVQIQRDNDWSDREMAERLGCSRPLWNLIRRGKAEISGDLAVRAVGAFPELTVDLLGMAQDSAKTVAIARKKRAA